MRPFGCPVIILNTIDHLGKFDGKADEGFFVGYSTNSKAFRVFNSRTRIVEENLHVQFSENTPNIAGSGPNWLFDIDALTKSMNYKPVVAGNQSNGNADPHFSSSSKDSPDAGFNPLGEEEKKDLKDPENKDSEVPSTEETRVNQEKDANIYSTNNINIISLTVNAVGIKDNAFNENTVYECADDTNMPNLEEIDYSNDDEDVGAEADMTNLNTIMPVSPIPTTRLHKDRPLEQIIRDIHSAPQNHNHDKVVRAQEGNPSIKRSKLDRSYARRASAVQVTTVRPWWIYHMAKEPLTDDGIFISQDKCVDEILKKFGFLTVKTASTPMETSKPLMKDESVKDVDVHLYRSMIRSLMYLTSLRHDIMFAVCACARFQVTPKVSHVHAVKGIFRYLKGQPKLGL
ncbi:uncharacterized mitochondrial protein-like protein [Tanacetum coccineum]